jgi:hypothetical protein
MRKAKHYAPTILHTPQPDTRRQTERRGCEECLKMKGRQFFYDGER